MAPQKVILRDSTLREGLDVPGVTLDNRQKRIILDKLVIAGVPEAEVIAPGHFERDVASLNDMETGGMLITLSGLVYGYGTDWKEQLRMARKIIHRVDVLIPLSGKRPPYSVREKLRQMREVLEAATMDFGQVGVGFPHATQVDSDFTLKMCLEAAQAGAQRITLYDTNGSSDPWAVAELIGRTVIAGGTDICFHGHNDLGMATANSIAAVLAGAACVDVTVNGLGDRAGNASLEQVAVALNSRGIHHGLRLEVLKDLSGTVEEVTRIPVPQLAPVVGEFVFCHKSPSHLESPDLFEAFDPSLLGTTRSVCSS